MDFEDWEVDQIEHENNYSDPFVVEGVNVMDVNANVRHRGNKRISIFASEKAIHTAVAMKRPSEIEVKAFNNVDGGALVGLSPIKTMDKSITKQKSSFAVKFKTNK